MASYHTQAPESVYIPSHHATTTTDINKIRDWLPWSIINIFLGWGLGGVIPLIFTMFCRYNKRSNDLKGAKIMSKLALVFNILVTLSGLAGWAAFIALLALGRLRYNDSYPK